MAKILNFSGQIRPLSLSLGTSLSFSLKLLFQLLNTSLDLLDVLLALAYNGLLVFKFEGQALDVLLLHDEGVLNVSLVPLQFSNLVLSQLQLSLGLPTFLLKVSTRSLLLVNRRFNVIQSAFKLVLDRGQMGELVLSNLKIFSRLGGILTDVLFLLVQLVDDLILLGNFIIERADGMVTVGLLSLNLLDVLLDNIDASSMLLDLSRQLNPGGFFRGQLLLSSSKFGLILSLLSISLGLSLSVLGDVTLGLGKSTGQLLDLLLHLN